MTLDEFEAAGNEPWQVMQQEWVDIMHRHATSLNQQPSDTEYKNFHEYDVQRALETGLSVPDRVLQDYPLLVDKVAQQQKHENDFRQLKIGDPVTVRINYFGTMAEGFFVGFLPHEDALVYIKVKGRNRPMQYSRHEIFVRNGNRATAAEMKSLNKWRLAAGI